jgi:protein-disulfide isomerase
MSSRVAHRAAARQARVEKEVQVRAAATRRRRLYAVGAAAALALAVVAVAISSGRGSTNASSGGKLNGAAASAALFAGIPQHGTLLGDPRAPVRIIEFADLQCPYCQEYTAQALPSLVREYVRPGKVQMQFENLSFIGPGSVEAGHYAAAAATENRLWNFIDLMYLNQGTENSGYVTPGYLQRLLQATPGLNVPVALTASRAPAADEALLQATRLAASDGINSTPSFLIGRLGGPLRLLQPPALAPAPFAAAINGVLGGKG